MLAASIAKAGYARKVPKKEVGFNDAGFVSPRLLLRIRQEGRGAGHSLVLYYKILTKLAITNFHYFGIKSNCIL